MRRRASARALTPRPAASSRPPARAGSRLRRRPCIELERADLAEAELRADGRRGIAVGLDDRRLATVSARVIEAPLHERRVRAVSPMPGARRAAPDEPD